VLFVVTDRFRPIPTGLRMPSSLPAESLATNVSHVSAASALDWVARLTGETDLRDGSRGQGPGLRSRSPFFPSLSVG